MDNLVHVAWDNLPSLGDTQNLSLGRGSEQLKKGGPALSKGLDMRPLEVPPV